jgi:hypothetical protein
MLLVAIAVAAGLGFSREAAQGAIEELGDSSAARPARRSRP